MDIGKPSSARTRDRTDRAISADEPKRCVHPATAAKASSMAMRSMDGVKSYRTSRGRGCGLAVDCQNLELRERFGA
jgi:hypothetical protein